MKAMKVEMVRKVEAEKAAEEAARLAALKAEEEAVRWKVVRT